MDNDQKSIPILLFGGALGYILGGLFLLGFIFFGLFYATKSLAIAVTAIAVVSLSIIGKFYPFLWKNPFYRKYLAIILILGCLRVVIGDEYLESIRDWWRAQVGFQIGSLEETKAIVLPSGTPLHSRTNDGKIVYKDTLKTTVEAQILPGFIKSDKGIKYRRALLPVKDTDGQYIKGAFGENSEEVLIILTDLKSNLAKIDKKQQTPVAILQSTARPTPQRQPAEGAAKSGPKTVQFGQDTGFMIQLSSVNITLEKNWIFPQVPDGSRTWGFVMDLGPGGKFYSPQGSSWGTCWRAPLKFNQELQKGTSLYSPQKSIKIWALTGPDNEAKGGDNFSVGELVYQPN